MTSISPWAAAALQISDAKSQMQQAASAAVRSEPRPGLPGPLPHPVEIEAPEAMLPVAPFHDALVHATRGLQSIDRALGFRDVIAAEVVVALENAATQAKTGIGLIDSTHTGIIEPAAVSGRFSSTALWLGLAGSLMTLNHDTRMPVGPPPRPFPIRPLPHPIAG